MVSGWHWMGWVTDFMDTSQPLMDRCEEAVCDLSRMGGLTIVEGDTGRPWSWHAA